MCRYVAQRFPRRSTQIKEVQVPACTIACTDRRLLQGKLDVCFVERRRLRSCPLPSSPPVSLSHVNLDTPRPRLFVRQCDYHHVPAPYWKLQRHVPPVSTAGTASFRSSHPTPKAKWTAQCVPRKSNTMLWSLVISPGSNLEGSERLRHKNALANWY